MNNFSARLKSLMEGQGLTQQALAEKARCSQASIYRYLSKEVRPQPKALADLAHALNVRPEWLETGKGEKHSSIHPRASRLVLDYPPTAETAEAVRLMESQEASPFASHSEKELWLFIAETAARAELESRPLNQRVHLGNIQQATAELQRRLPAVQYSRS